MEESNQPKPESVKEETILKWQALEYKDYQRNWKWFLLVGFVLLAISAYSVYTKDWFTIVIIFILIGFLNWYIKQKPQLKDYKITQLGIYVGERFYPYNEIHSFWLTLKPELFQANILFNKKYLPQLSILLNDIDPLAVKVALGKFIPEQEDRDESIIDFLMRVFKL